MRLIHLYSLLAFLQFSHAFADYISYSLDGSYLNANQKPVIFKLNWKEREGRMKGTYVDNHHSFSVPIQGERNARRVISITFPKDSEEPQLIRILTLPIKGAQKATIPVSVLFEVNSKKFNREIKATFEGKP